MLKERRMLAPKFLSQIAIIATIKRERLNFQHPPTPLPPSSSLLYALMTRAVKFSYTFNHISPKIFTFQFGAPKLTCLSPGTSLTISPLPLTQTMCGIGVPRAWHTISVPVVLEKSTWLGGSWINTGPDVSDWPRTEMIRRMYVIMKRPSDPTPVTEN